MSTPQIVKPGSIVCRTENKGASRNLDGTVVDNDGSFVPDADQFIINTGTPEFPFFSFGVLTGRTRRMWGMSLPTVERFAVETIAVANEQGTFTIVGVPGERIPGTFVTRWENVEEAS